jgi:hypothetical protein
MTAISPHIMSNTKPRSLLSTHASSGLPPSSGNCPLLDLPTELRLQIWGYVLYEPQGLFYRYVANDLTFRLYRTLIWTTQMRNFTAARAREIRLPVANQLKTVCKLMHSDTKALPLNVNKQITFTQLDVSQPTALDQFRDFTMSCSKRSQSQLRLVILEDAERPSPPSPSYWDPPPWEPGRASLEYAAWFCRTHPHASMMIMLHALNFEGDPRGCTLRTGYWILTRLRRQECPWPYTSVLLRIFNTKVKDFAPINVPANLRFFPTNAATRARPLVYNPARWLRVGVNLSTVHTWRGIIDSWYQEGL